MDLRANDWYSYVYPFDAATLARLAYFFVDRNVNAAYIEAAAKHVNRLRQRVDSWRAAWKRPDGQSPVRWINDAGDCCGIIDSRSGTEIRYEIAGAAAQVLRYLPTPHRLDEVTREFGMEGVRAIESLREQALLFEEDDRLMALATTMTLHAASTQAGAGSEAIPSVMAVAGVIGSLWPVYRATRVDPAVALREL